LSSFSVVLQLKQQGLDEPSLVGDGVLALVDVLAGQRRLDHCLDVPTVDLAVVQELETLCDHGVPGDKKVSVVTQVGIRNILGLVWLVSGWEEN